jgi:hypothetical protein
MNVLYVREKISEIAGVEFEKLGLIPDSRYTWYTRKAENSFGKVRCYIHCIKNFSSIEFTLTFEYTIEELMGLKIALQKLRGEAIIKAPTFTIGEGEFYRALEGENFKIRSNFYHKVTSEEDLLKECNLCKEIFVQDIAPMIPILSNLKNFQDYLIAENFKITSQKFILPGLLAMKMLGSAYYESFSQQVANYFDFNNNKEHYVIEYVEQIRSM